MSRFACGLTTTYGYGQPSPVGRGERRSPNRDAALDASALIEASGLLDVDVQQRRLVQPQLTVTQVEKMLSLPFAHTGAMNTTTLACGETVPALGQGTWMLGDDPGTRQEEIATIRRGIDQGLTLLDTAEMYGDGRSESLVGEAIAGRRDAVFLVSKVYPHHASRAAMRRSCEASLRRLGVETLDLYLLHWEGNVPLAETVDGFEALRRAGRIRHWGVSNFDVQAMGRLWGTPGGEACQTNQVLYNLGSRGIEWDLLPAMRARGLPVMAYSPFDQGRLLRNAALVRFARDCAMTPAQVALAWLLARDGVVAIPKTARHASLEENLLACERPLSAAQLAALDTLFPPPTAAMPLAML